MNTGKKILCAGLSILMLAGCKDATASLKDSSAAIMTVGSKTVTKGDVYNTLFYSIGSNTVQTNVMSTIAEQEIELTDDMKESAQSQIDVYRMMYGDQLDTFLKQMNITEEEYLNDYVIPDMRSAELVKKYTEENFDSLCSTYNPIKVIVLSFTSEEDASAALSSLKDGSATAAEAASANNSSSTGTEEIITIETLSYDSAALSVLRSASPDDGWAEVPSTDGATFYVLKVVSNTPSEFKEEALTTLSSIGEVNSESQEYYLRKYNFHVYDINLYNMLKNDAPEMLIQDYKAAVATTAPAEESAAPAEESTAPAEASAAPAN